MNLRRGDVVLVGQPYSSGIGGKRRPVVVIQNDRDNQRLSNTIVAQITSTTFRASEPTQLLIDVATPGGKQTGLHTDSVVNCLNLSTVEQRRIVRLIGSLAPPLMQQVEACLKTALALP